MRNVALPTIGSTSVHTLTVAPRTSSDSAYRRHRHRVTRCLCRLMVPVAEPAVGGTKHVVDLHHPLPTGRASRVHSATPTKRRRIVLATYIWFYTCVPEVDPSLPSGPRRRLRRHGVRWTARPKSSGRFTRPVGR